MDRLPVRTSLLLALGTAILGYLGLYAFSHFLPVLLSVFLVGTGYGSNGLLVTTLTSFAPAGRMRNIYAFQYSLATSAAALGPALISWFVMPLGGHMPFLFSAGMLGLSSVILLSLRESALPRLEAPERFYTRVRQWLSRRQTVKLLISVAMGWFCTRRNLPFCPCSSMARWGGRNGWGARCCFSQ